MPASSSAQEFVERWERSAVNEKGTAQPHFIDPCRLLGIKTPAKTHAALDRAVLDAYGWPHDVSDDDILARLLALNGERASAT